MGRPGREDVHLGAVTVSRLAAAAGLAAALVGCTGPSDSGAPDASPVCTAVGPFDDSLTLADVQALGTHNSYHIEPDTVLDSSHAYTQPTLDAQADVGVRAFELDVHLGDDGAFQVFHLPGIDPESSCPTFAGCLEVLRTWSDAHPCHTPFTVWIEPKDDLDEAAAGFQLLDGHMNELDAAIGAVWPRARRIQPDEVQGTAASVSEGIATTGWPLLADSRGKIVFALLDSGPHRDEYLQHPSPVIFADANSQADPWAATFKIDDAPGEAGAVQALVAANYLVTSNVDSVGDDDATRSAMFQASLDAGPNYLASNQVVPVDGSTYLAGLPGGSPRCHPARVAAGCGPGELEP